MVSRQYTQCFSNFLPEHENLEGQWEVAISEISYPSMYQNITEGKFKVFDKKLSKSTATYNLEPGLYTSITVIVEAMNTLIQERNNHNETCKAVKVFRRRQKVVTMIAIDSSALAYCSTDLGHIFGNNVGSHFGVPMKRKGPHEPQFAYDIARIHFLMFYSDLVECNIVGDTKAPLIRRVPLPKNSFHSLHIGLRDTSGEKIPFVSVGITRFVLMFKKASNIHL